MQQDNDLFDDHTSAATAVQNSGTSSAKPTSMLRVCTIVRQHCCGPQHQAVLVLRLAAMQSARTLLQTCSMEHAQHPTIAHACAQNVTEKGTHEPAAVVWALSWLRLTCAICCASFAMSKPPCVLLSGCC